MWCSMSQSVRSVTAPRSLDSSGTVVLGIDGLAHVVQQGGQQEFLVIRPRIASEMEHLEAVVEHIALRVVLGVLLDGLRGTNLSR